MPTTFFRCLLLLLLIIVHSSCYAASAYEQEQLSLIQRQLDTIELLSTGAKATGEAEPDKRYRFDYTRLIQDIQRIRQGVRGYLSLSRAQPRDTDELAGDYRLDASHAEPSP